MALGSATHLWLFGTPSPETLRAWVLEAVPAATEADVHALRLGQRTLLTAINTSDRDSWSRSVHVISGIKPQGVESVFIGVYPDTGDWEVLDRSGAHADTEEDARAVVGAVVPLDLKELHHYVDWAHEVEELETGALVPSLGEVRAEVLTLGLPPGPARPMQAFVQKVESPVGQVTSAVVKGFGWAVLLPYLAFGLAAPVFAWWHLLRAMISPLELSGIGLILVMETGFLLPFVLVWRRLPNWARAVVIGVHVGGFAAGLFHAL